ncbi:MAG: CPBP family glutamic-type intramembrane protease [Candidatus Hodarchaeales archaeon]|jgi:hypothetical protein
MKKIEIVEIENSYLNFFTPAIMIAAGFFLWNLLMWPLSILNLYSEQLDIEIYLLNVILEIFSGLLVCLIVYYIFIPHLNVLDADYQRIKSIGLIIVFLVFGLAIFYRLLVTIIFESIGTNIYSVGPWFVFSDRLFHDPRFTILFLIYTLIVFPLFSELVFRRTVIPLLEDRGLSPFHAVLMSSFGFCLLDLPYYVTNPNILANLFWFISTFIFGFATGVIYIFTRNVIFSIIYVIMYTTYRLTNTFGYIFNTNFFFLLRDLFHLAVIPVGLALTGLLIWNFVIKPTPEWIKVIKYPSVPNIRRGTIGFLIISFILVYIQIYVPTTIENFIQEFKKIELILLNILLHSIYYLIVFSIPIWLTTKSEYTQY